MRMASSPILQYLRAWTVQVVHPLWSCPVILMGDRDTDLVVLREGQPAKVFVNDPFGQVS